MGLSEVTHNFILTRRRSKVSKTFPLIIGISGVARCGKDTLADFLIKKFSRMKIPSVKLSLALPVKQDLDQLLISRLGISAFTEAAAEKEIIRPILIAYTGAARQIDPDFWIKRSQQRLDSCLTNGIVAIMPDIRYETEAKWIKKTGGFLIHVTRETVGPANFEEKANDPIVKNLSDYQIVWKNFTDAKKTCNLHINKLFALQGWTTYGKFK